MDSLRCAFLTASILYGGKYKSQLYNENKRTLEHNYDIVS